jgi:hypothetical protein
MASPPGSTRTGPGRVLIAIYALFALAASARAGVQIATKFGHAPVAYLLSAFAGVVYILATVTLAVGSPTARRIAVVSCSVELAGVLAVGTWSIADPATFPDATVWSGYGSGYGFVPLVLPVFGLLWLRRWAGRPRTRRTIVTSAGGPSEAASGGVDRGEGGEPGQSAEDVVAYGRTQLTCPADSPNPHRAGPASGLCARSAIPSEIDRQEPGMPY